MVNNLDWEPSEASFAEQEDAMTDFRGQVINYETVARGRRIINSISTSCKFHDVDFTDCDNFFDALNDKFNVARVEVSKGKHGFNHEKLSKNRMLSPDCGIGNCIMMSSSKP